MVRRLHEKTSAAAAPRKPKKGAVSSPLKVEEDIVGKLEELIGSEIVDNGVWISALKKSGDHYQLKEEDNVTQITDLPILYWAETCSAAVS